ncbi:MAG: TonB-dependent receptor, partial [Bacteroidota bacterium]
GVISDAEGRYSLNLSATSQIIFSYIGFKSQTVSINGRSMIDVTMEANIEDLEEVVVVGYGVQKKVNLTGAVSTVNSEDITKVPATNISQTLRGKVPGLQMQQRTGAPGLDAAQISIRGFGNPLVLVNGVEMDWERIDPNDIESISVLKDAAAAIYGNRAGNGVILITTKRGEAGKTSINYSGNITFQDPILVPQFVNSWQYATLLREGETFQGLPVTYSDEDIQKFRDGSDPAFADTDWYDVIMRDWAPMHSHNLNARGGNESIQYFMSAGFMEQGSAFESGDLNFRRYNARSSIDAKVSQGMTMSFDLSYNNEIREQPQDGLARTWIDIFWARPEHPHELPDPSLGGAFAGFNATSPYRQTFSDYTGSIDESRENILGSITLDYKIPGVEGLTLNANLNYMKRTEYLKIQDRTFDVFDYDYTSDTYVFIGVNGTNRLDERTRTFSELFPRLSLTYKKSFGDHNFSGLLIGQSIINNFNELSAGKVDLISQDLPYLYAGAVENTIANSFETEASLLSYIGRVNYNYKEKYLVELSLRADGSYKFPPNNRWGYFPSVSAGWRVTEENFMQGAKSWIDNLKIRASYSRTGDDDLGSVLTNSVFTGSLPNVRAAGNNAFNYLSGFGLRSAVGDNFLNTNYIFGNDVFPLISPTRLANPNITWLNMTVFNVGVDASFMNGLLYLEADYFYRIVDNIFGEPVDQFPSTFGAALPQLNLNSTDNRGVELKLTYRKRFSSGFSYSVFGNFLYARETYRDWVEQPFDDPDEQRIFQREGKDVNTRIGFVSDGIFMSQQEIDEHPVNQDESGNITLIPGDIKYVDLNNDGVINFRDQQEIGFGNFPNITYGFGANVEFKGISLSVLFDGASQFNHYVNYIPFNNFAVPMDFHWEYSWRATDLENPTQNTNPDARLPALLGDGTGRNFNNEKISDFWLQDGTYLRLRELNLTYSFPKQIIQKAGFEDLRLSFSATNILTFSRLGIYKNSIDPEAVDRNQWSYPLLKTFAFGLNLTL